MPAPAAPAPARTPVGGGGAVAAVVAGVAAVVDADIDGIVVELLVRDVVVVVVAAFVLWLPYPLSQSKYTLKYSGDMASRPLRKRYIFQHMDVHRAAGFPMGMTRDVLLGSYDMCLDLMQKL